MFKIRCFFIPLVFLVTFFLVSPAAQGASQKIPVNLGILPVVDTLPLLVGVERGFFEDHGIDLKLISFSSALERDLALQSGKINGYFGDLLNTMLLINAGQGLSILTAVFHTNPRHRMFALLASPKSVITSIRQTEGEEVAISKASVIEYVLDRMLAQRGLQPTKIKKTEIRAIPIRCQMLLADKIRLAVLPEPLATKAESEGARALADDRDLDVTLTVLALKSDLVQKFPDLVTRLTGAYKRSVDAVNQNPELFKELLVQKTQFPPSLKQAYKVPSFPPVQRPVKKDIASVQNWLLERGLITKPKAYDAVVLP